MSRPQLSNNRDRSCGLPAAVTGLFQGVLLFFLLASDVLTQYRLRIGRPRAPRRAEA